MKDEHGVIMLQSDMQEVVSIVKKMQEEENNMDIQEKFNPTEFGWVSVKTPPVNHNSVVVLVWMKTHKLYTEVIGYYEENEWEVRDVDDNDFEIQGWFPYPYTPHNH